MTFENGNCFLLESHSPNLLDVFEILGVIQESDKEPNLELRRK